MERRFSFKGVEGLFEEVDGERGVVICHPHPLYGGNMYNNVVEALREGFKESGFSTLRFNFRGVDEAKEDLSTALEFLKSELPHLKRLIVAGYSFGAYIVSLFSPKEMLLVSYPIAFYPPEPLLSFKGKIWMVCGDRDDIAPLDDLKRVFDAMECKEKHMEVLPSDHFFWGFEEEIKKLVVGWMGG